MRMTGREIGVGAGTRIHPLCGYIAKVLQPTANKTVGLPVYSVTQRPNLIEVYWSLVLGLIPNYV